MELDRLIAGALLAGSLLAFVAFGVWTNRRRAKLTPDQRAVEDARLEEDRIL